MSKTVVGKFIPKSLYTCQEATSVKLTLNISQVLGTRFERAHLAPAESV